MEIFDTILNEAAKHGHLSGFQVGRFLARRDHLWRSNIGMKFGVLGPVVDNLVIGFIHGCSIWKSNRVEICGTRQQEGFILAKKCC